MLSTVTTLYGAGAIALAVVLLAGAGLMVRGFQTLVGASSNLRSSMVSGVYDVEQAAHQNQDRHA